MRIAQVAPLQVAVPPTHYGGTERVVATLTDALTALGHDVTLFASGDSRTRARLVPFVPRALGFDPSAGALDAHLALLTEVYRRAGEFDVIHSHLEQLTLPFTSAARMPTVLTFHSRIDAPALGRLVLAYPDVHYVSISDSQREPIAGAHWAATVYHGIEVRDFPYAPEPGNYLVFVGRIAPEKRPDRAIAIARLAGVPLKIAAKVDPKDRAYYKRVVEPLLGDPLIEFLGPVDERRKRRLMAGALALLLPIDWPEPFGMVFIESLACGTPVLTRPCGAAPEVVKDGVTGFVREGDEELAAAVREVSALSRARCREEALRRFDAATMAEGYVQVYQRALVSQ